MSGTLPAMSRLALTVNGKPMELDVPHQATLLHLLRNDLGRSCTPGSIHVDRLFEVQSFPTVHHLVSTISGELRADRSAWELLRDSFTGGSITGAPKRRAIRFAQAAQVRTRVDVGAGGRSRP